MVKRLIFGTYRQLFGTYRRDNLKKIFNEKNMRMILNHIDDGVQIVNNTGELIYCNKKAAMIDDIAIDETIGKHITEIYPNLTKENSTLLKVLETGIPILMNEQTYLTYKGNKISTVNSTLPIKYNNELYGAIEISSNITDVKKLTEKVTSLQEMVYGNNAKTKEENDLYTFDDIITQDKNVIQAKEMGIKSSQNDANVLVYGSTGTGKELLVQAIHGMSKRRDQSFIAQNCAAFPKNLLESILFGTVKGSFTGSTNKAGLFEIADGGTLFLDEINSMPMELQAKLLRVLQDGKVRRVGATQEKVVDVRVIVATNLDPYIAVEKNTLRRDLFYRLNTIMIEMIDLAEREGDIDLLTDYFIKKFNKKFYKNIQGVSKEVKNIFKSYDWPGNVRELEHIIEGIISVSDKNIITKEDLPKPIINKYKKFQSEIKSFNLKDKLETMEHKYIKNAMKQTGQNITESAKLLGIPRQTLQYKLNKYNL